MRILLADDQQKVRFALHVLLEQRPEVLVVGEAKDADELLAILNPTRPELLILDWTLPGLTEIGSIPALRKKKSDLYIIALSSRPELGKNAIEAGANAFISKIDPPDRLLATVAECQSHIDQSRHSART
jgi:DNA-binding NarL/FixJ family response regulator